MFKRAERSLWIALLTVPGSWAWALLVGESQLHSFALTPREIVTFVVPNALGCALWMCTWGAPLPSSKPLVRLIGVAAIWTLAVAFAALAPRAVGQHGMGLEFLLIPFLALPGWLSVVGAMVFGGDLLRAIGREDPSTSSTAIWFRAGSTWWWGALAAIPILALARAAMVALAPDTWGAIPIRPGDLLGCWALLVSLVLPPCAVGLVTALRGRRLGYAVVGATLVLCGVAFRELGAAIVSLALLASGIGAAPGWLAARRAKGE